MRDYISETPDLVAINELRQWESPIGKTRGELDEASTLVLVWIPLSRQLESEASRKETSTLTL